jgi:hypothetical protein
MKLLLVASVLFVALDGLLYHGLRGLEAERRDLSRRREELTAAAEAARETQVRDGRAERLLLSASRSMGKVDRTLDIAELRDLLLDAERGLAIDRFSLEFHPAQDSPSQQGSGRVSASLGGAFAALFAYLARIEEARLPLSAEALSLRATERGAIVLTIEWTARWSAGENRLEELSPQDIERLERWLASAPAPPPGGDFFRGGREAGASLPERAVTNLSVPPPDIMETSAPPTEELRELPRLTGFVTARPEVESDIRRRVLAAIRFDGELRLLGIGDRVGAYEIEEIDGVASVVLLDSETGERLKLSLP